MTVNFGAFSIILTNVLVTPLLAKVEELLLVKRLVFEYLLTERH